MATPTADFGDRGRSAGKPSDIPKPGWRDIALRLKKEMSSDYTGLAAAGVAFYFLLAIVPALTATISIYGLIADAQDVTRHVEGLSGLLPPEAMAIIESQMASIAETSGGALGLGAAIGILFALWSASTGVKALIKGMNIAYEEEEKRGFLRLYLVTFAFTLGAVLFLILTVALLAVVPIVLQAVLPQAMAGWVALVRWPMLLLAVIIALALLYRFAPSRSRPQWSWVSVGAVVAAVAWLVGSALFSLYVSNFADYNETYGSMGAIVILMLWFWITAFVFILGAALNAEMEHQTRRDTTHSPERPMGERQANKADTLGRKP
jgi:membrane protein